MSERYCRNEDVGANTVDWRDMRGRRVTGMRWLKERMGRRVVGMGCLKERRG